MRCTAHRRNGEPCGSWAVKGANVCRMHGGSIPRVKAAAARRLEEEKARRIALKVTGPVEVDPSQALIDLVHSAAGEVAYWRGEVDRIQAEHPQQMTMSLARVEKGQRDRSDVDMKHLEAGVPVAYRMWVDARERLAKYAATAIKAGIEERRVKIAEAQGQQIAALIRAILADRELDLTSEQAAAAPRVAARHLRLLAS